MKAILNLKERNLLVVEYEKEFNHLSKYALESVLTKTFRCRQFEDGLNESIKRYLAHVTVLQQVNFYQLVQVAMKVENLRQAVEKDFKRESFLEELLPPRVKELESPNLSQYRVWLQDVEDREVQWYLDLVEVFQLDKEKSPSAVIAIDDI